MGFDLFLKKPWGLRSEAAEHLVEITILEMEDIGVSYLDWAVRIPSQMQKPSLLQIYTES